MWDHLDDESLRSWARRAMTARRIPSGAELARLAGEDPSTINRWLNRTTRRPKPDTIQNISRVLQLEPGELPSGERLMPAPSTDAEPVNPRHSTPIETFLEFADLVRSGGNRMAPMAVTGDSLRGLGYLPGDVLLVDMNTQPEPHDIVCAQLYDWNQPGKTVTVFRVFEPPFLVTPAIELGDMTPLPIDGRRVAIRGVVVGCIRGRRSTRVAA